MGDLINLPRDGCFLFPSMINSECEILISASMSHHTVRLHYLRLGSDVSWSLSHESQSQICYCIISTSEICSQLNRQLALHRQSMLRYSIIANISCIMFIMYSLQSDEKFITAVEKGLPTRLFNALAQFQVRLSNPPFVDFAFIH